MSLMALAWAALAAVLLLLSLKRPAYAVAFYMMTFFAAPHLWWWGSDLPALRYSFLSGFAVIGAVLFQRALAGDETGQRFGRVHKAAIAMAVNATFVHFLIGSTPSVSISNYIELLKYVLLFFLMCAAIRTKGDLRIVIMAIAIGAGYIGYEATINERGTFTGGRLEGIGAPAADTANSLASVLLLALPLVGSLVVQSNWRNKITAAVAAPLVLNVVLLCNSRGAFLGLIAAGASVLVMSRGATRKQAFKALALGGVTLYLLLGDPKILERFSTTFVGSEERDASAAGRLEFWEAGLRMLQDYPLGDGGGSFKWVRGKQYLAEVTGRDVVERSLHNGYLTEATEWGIQGLLFRLIFIGGACAYAYRANVACRKAGLANDALMGICFIAALISFLVATIFGSFMSNEWSYWIIALLVRYGDLYGVPVAVAAPAANPSERFAEAPQWAPTERTA